MSIISEIFDPSADYPGLTDLLEATAKSMFPNNEIGDKADLATTGDQVALVEYEDLLGQVVDACFSREPKLFGNIQWFNTDLGTPLWVRPGVKWIPNHELTTDELDKGLTMTIVSTKKTKPGVTELSLKALNQTQAAKR